MFRIKGIFAQFLQHSWAVSLNQRCRLTNPICSISFGKLLPWNQHHWLLCFIGIKHGFSCINIRRSRGRYWKPRPEAAVFNTSQGTWRMLMHWKTMFDRYYCIKTENICYISHYFLHYFVLPFHRCLANAISNFYGLCLFKGRTVHMSWRQQIFGPGTSILKVA